jgi:S-adenosylmethionine/arginine decarboxylase-like enzyme
MEAPTRASTGAADAGVVEHLVAELAGVPAARLTDVTLLGGLLIAAAGAAGLHAVAAPLLRADPRGVDALLLLEGGHLALHAHAGRRTLLVDILAPGPAELARALDVLTRRLAPAAVAAERLVRLPAAPRNT